MSTAVKRARDHYMTASRNLRVVRLNYTDGLVSYTTVKCYERFVLDALDQLAGAQEFERKMDTGPWVTPRSWAIVVQDLLGYPNPKKRAAKRWKRTWDLIK